LDNLTARAPKVLIYCLPHLLLIELAIMSTFEIPGYSIIRPIDTGGMATVYLAEQKSLGRKVAIKVMAEHLNRDKTFAERFEQEARIASHLAHPNIVTIFDYGTITSTHNGSTLYLVMAFIEGQDLKSLQPKLSLVTRLKIIQDIANALDYAHQQGVIHRDIKPQNILVHSEGNRALLTDFGIAKARRNAQELTQTGMTLGTPHYMSPEQALGKAVDHRADIYSLGVVLYFLLTGNVPYEGESEVAIGLKHFTDPIPQLPEIFTCFQLIINKALAKQPEERYQTAALFAQAVGEVSIGNLATLVQSINDQSEAETRVNHVISPTPTHSNTSGKKRNLTYVVSATLAGALTASALIWWLMPNDKTSGPTPHTPSYTPTPTENLETFTPATPEATPQQKPVAAFSEEDELAAQDYPNNPEGFNCSYKLLSDWGSGWQGQITLRNDSDHDVNNWLVSFDLPRNASITNSFVTDVQRRGEQHSLIPRDWNRTLKANNTIELGFQGDGPAPQNINSINCTSQ
jgi:serine/threonine protein kinase